MLATTFNGSSLEGYDGSGLKKNRFLEKVFRFLGFLGFNVRKNRTLNYDPEIQEEYFIHNDTPIPLSHHL